MPRIASFLGSVVACALLLPVDAKSTGAAAIAPGGPRHAKSEAFLAWAARYDDGGPEDRTRALHEGWLAALPCPVLRLTTPATVEAHVAEVMRWLGSP